MKIIDYFDWSNKTDVINEKSVFKFAITYYSNDNSLIIDSSYIKKICVRLCFAGILICLKYWTGVSYNGVYLFLSKDNGIYQKCRHNLIYI